MTTLDQFELKELFDHLLTLDFTPREKLVLHLRYWDGETLRAVGDRLKVTPERIRQIEAKALRKLRSRLPAHGLSKAPRKAPPKAPPETPAPRSVLAEIQALAQRWDKPKYTPAEWRKLIWEQGVSDRTDRQKFINIAALAAAAALAIDRDDKP
jgi:hypothetical protein